MVEESWVSQRNAVRHGTVIPATVHTFLAEHGNVVSEPILSEARAIDARRRLRPHLERLHRRRT